METKIARLLLASLLFVTGATPVAAQPEITVGLDGSKQPQDLGVNANLGPRIAANWGVPLVPSAGIGFQVGAAFNAADAAVAVLKRMDGTSGRSQLFATIGLFQRTDRVRWGVGLDAVRQSYFDSTRLTQVRGEAVVAAGPRDWLGAWFTHRLASDDARIGDTAVRLAPIAQVNVVERHTWSSGARTGVWLGLAGSHDSVVLVFPDSERMRHVLVYGADLSMPLNERVSIVGAANLVTPSASGTVDAFMGIAFRLGRGAAGRFVPLLPVANNTHFSVDLSRR